MATVASSSAPVSVGAVIVTCDRPAQLRDTLAAALSQTWRPAEIWVADNGNDPGVRDLVGAMGPTVRYVAMPENLGYAAGLAAGMTEACRAAHQYVWLLDDDSVPAPEALERCLGVALATHDCGIVGLGGGMLRHGVPVHGRGAAGCVRREDRQARPCDFVLVDGAVVAAVAIRQVGLPRGDFFMMMEDVEYSGRLRRGGWKALVVDEDLIVRAHLGSGGSAGGEPGGSAPPWRGYYQTRNHLVMALEHRAPTEVWGWLVRQAKFVAAVVVRGDRRAERIGLRLLGAWHGLLRKGGRTVEPSDHA